MISCRVRQVFSWLLLLGVLVLGIVFVRQGRLNAAEIGIDQPSQVISWQSQHPAVFPPLVRDAATLS